MDRNLSLEREICGTFETGTERESLKNFSFGGSGYHRRKEKLRNFWEWPNNFTVPRIDFCLGLKIITWHGVMFKRWK